MIGSGVSSQRALVMFAVRVGADMSGRDYDLPTSLAFAAAVIVFCQPLYLFDAGFLLSFGALLGIAVVEPVLKIYSVVPGFLRGGTAIHLVLLPILLYYYYEIPDLFASFKSGGDPADVFRVGSRDLRKPCGAFRYADRKSSSFYM